MITSLSAGVLQTPIYLAVSPTIPAAPTLHKNSILKDQKLGRSATMRKLLMTTTCEPQKSCSPPVDKFTQMDLKYPIGGLSHAESVYADCLKKRHFISDKDHLVHDDFQQETPLVSFPELPLGGYLLSSRSHKRIFSF